MICSQCEKAVHVEFPPNEAAENGFCRQCWQNMIDEWSEEVAKEQADREEFDRLSN